MRVIHPISEKTGETLVETLAAILMCTLAVIMLTTAVLTASRLNQAASEQDANILTQREAAEQFSSFSGTGSNTITITVSSNGTENTYSNIPVYGGSDVMSYEVSE
jgi:type II secretory pathway pseudopilin PulG